MLQILSSAGVKFGPYKTVVLVDGVYVVNNSGCIPVSVIGDATVSDWTGPLPGLSEEALAELRADKLAEIDASRMQATRGTFRHQNKDILVDEQGRSDIDGVAIYVALNNTLPNNWPGVWKTIDGDTVPITNIAAFRDLYKSMVDTGTNNFLKAEALKNQVAAATTAEQIAAIRW